MGRHGLYLRMRTTAGRGDALEAVLLRAAELLGDVGECELYLVNRSPEDPDVVWMTEIWETESAHDRILFNDLLDALVSEAMGLLDGPPHITRVTPNRSAIAPAIG